VVIGPLFNIFTAFGIGELSGAGFGPNYTILMKLGFEFFAPRIIDELNKNPSKDFKDTQYWIKWQREMKMYSDDVMNRTLDRLLAVPDTVIQAIENKWGQNISDQALPSDLKDAVTPPLVNPSPLIDKWASTIFNLLSGYNIAANNYNIIKGHLENFFLGVSQFNSQVEKDARKIIEDAIANAIAPTPDPIPPVSEDPHDPDLKPTPEQQQPSGFWSDFIGNLSESDLKKGGKRTVNTRNGFMQWETKFMFSLNNVNQLALLTWNGSSFVRTKVENHSNTSALSAINSLKESQGIALVMQFSNDLRSVFFMVKWIGG